jgi:glycosyltransferase involved in cell wall biosynthesis
MFRPNYAPKDNYVAYLGRIIEPKGVHLAIQAVKAYNKNRPNGQKIKLKIAGKHYSGHRKDTYWQERIEPVIDNKEVKYVGFIDNTAAKQQFLSNAKALLVPSIFDEPFGMVMIEALACGTPIIALDSGAISEVVQHEKTGFIIKKTQDAEQSLNESAIADAFADAISKVLTLDRHACRQEFETRFTSSRMCKEHLAVYMRLIR